VADDEFQEVLGTFLDDDTVRPDLTPRLNKTFRKARSVVGEYATLVNGRGYEFRAFPSPVQAVSGAKRPLIPMLISVIPPDRYPTGETVRRKISAPPQNDIALTAVTERFSPQAGGSRNINRILPTSPEAAARIEELQGLLASGNLDSQATTNAQNEIDRLLAESRFIEVEVPVGTPAGEAQQVRRTDNYLDQLQDRYRQFQQNSREAKESIDLQNTRITGPNKTEVNDPYSRLQSIKRQRERTVKDDLEFLRLQAENMSSLPPLFMYVNPTTFAKGYAHIVSDGNKTRDGYTVEHWGEQLPTITATGQVGAFYVNSEDRLGRSAGGLAVSARKGSFAYQQFLSLFQVYRSNGYIYNAGGRISLVGSVTILYDNVLYTGSFSSMSLTHSEEKPFTFDYNFSFTVRFEQTIKDL